MVKGSKTVTEKAIRPGSWGVAQSCKYDAHRSDLLQIARARRGADTGLPYLENRSMIVQDALDLLLKQEGLLPADAPLFSSIVAQRRETGDE